MSAYNRRRFLKDSALAVAFFSTAGFLGKTSLVNSSEAAEKKGAAKKGTKEAPLPAGATEVPATDAVASAIGYNANALSVDAKTNPTYKKGQNCAGCALYVPSNESWGKCQMISSGLVKANGWCRSYSKKA